MRTSLHQKARTGLSRMGQCNWAGSREQGAGRNRLKLLTLILVLQLTNQAIGKVAEKQTIRGIPISVNQRK